ncbi:DUF58 domain-containing protein [Subtercola vilae]|uniref:DUF58 domain-containing protein n=1 Tax=Subtercola vilae TaxID=2056433 RepID=A0A4T2BTG8_9MICO|nr:DUF58 domain-containing protein [Subtercola vilae]TIH33741.1 DUF58 domain-containing protein [Subtercola vilae]
MTDTRPPRNRATPARSHRASARTNTARTGAAASGAARFAAARGALAVRARSGGAAVGRLTVVKVAVPRVRAGASGAWQHASPVVGGVLGVVSGFGWAVLGAAIVALVVGRAFGWLELTVLGVALLAALVLSVIFIVGRSAYSVTLNLAANRVVVGTRAVGSIVVGNASTRALLPSRVELPVGGGFASFQVPRLVPGAEHDDLFGIPTAKRAVITVGPVRSVRGDPLGLLRREIRWTEPELLFVHPQTVRIDGTSAGFIRDLEGQTSRVLSSDDVSFHALREYVPGDDRRNIHWKTSARTGVLMVKQFEETRRSHLALALSTNAADYATADEFELAISSCGSLGLQALKEERDVTVMVQGSTLHSETGRRLLDDLSSLEQTERRDTIVHLAKVAGQQVPDASVAVLMFGAQVTATQLQAATVYIPLGVRIIAVSCRPGAAVSRRMIGDLTLLTIGALDELPAALRRVNS